jgi:hypothetical protein
MDRLDPIQIEIFRKLSFQEKWAIAQGMHRLARETRTRVLKRENPTWTDTEVEAAIAHELIHRKP